HGVEDNLDGSLILLVAAGNGDRHDGLIVMEDEGGAEGNSRALAGRDDVWSAGICVEADEPGTVNNAGAIGHAGCAGQAAGSGDDDVAVFVSHTHDGGSTCPWTGD